MAQYKNIFTGLKQLFSAVGYDKTIVMPDTSGTVSLVGKTETLVGKTLTSPTINTPTIVAPSGSASTGLVIAKRVSFTQVSGGATYTGSVAIPAGATVHAIQVVNTVLWGGASAALKVGDADDDDGYFAAVDLKATDHLVGEVLSTADDGLWGGKNGAYLTSAGRRGNVAAGNSGNYYGVANTITGIIAVGTPGTATNGRTFMTVIYSVGEASAATVA